MDINVNNMLSNPMKTLTMIQCYSDCLQSLLQANSYYKEWHTKFGNQGGRQEDVSKFKYYTICFATCNSMDMNVNNVLWNPLKNLIMIQCYKRGGDGA